jgi:hypothetical protein
MPKRTLPLILTICGAAVVCSGAADPFVGHWSLNASKSAISDQMTIRVAGSNMYTLVFSGSGETETVAADGTDHPGIYGSTISITVEGPDTWKIVRKRKGRTVLTALWKLSGDGQTLRDAFSTNRPDGSTSTLDMIYRRAAGSAGIPGTWETTDVKVEGAHKLEIRPYDGNGLTFISSDSASPKKIKFDGKEYGDRTGANGGSASAGRRIGRLGLELTDTINGKILDTRQLTLSPDLKTLTMVVHPAGQRLPTTLVFDRD